MAVTTSKARYPSCARRQRLASVANGFAKIDELPLEGRERGGHWIGGGSGVVIGDRRGLARIVLHLPGGQFVAG